MSIEDAGLETRTQAILSMNVLRQVNFAFGRYIVNQGSFHKIAECVKDGKIKCKVDTSKLTEGSAAMYDASSNIIFGKDARFSNNDEMMNMVHEATHAWFDHEKLVMPRLDNETCAYLAGALFGEAVKAPVKGVRVTENPGRGDIHGQALVIVQSKLANTKGANAGQQLTFDTKDVGPLQAAIRASPLYKKEYKKVDKLDGVR